MQALLSLQLANFKLAYFQPVKESALVAKQVVIEWLMVAALVKPEAAVLAKPMAAVLVASCALEFQQWGSLAGDGAYTS